MNEQKVDTFKILKVKVDPPLKNFDPIGKMIDSVIGESLRPAVRSNMFAGKKEEIEEKIELENLEDIK